MFRILNKKRGFTLVESIIVIAIIVILSLIILPNYYSTKQQLALERAAIKLAQDIRTVQEMAMSAQEYLDCLGTSGYEYGYGIFFKESEPTKYTLFADCNGDREYNVGEDKKIGEAINFEQGIEIESLSFNFLRIVFTPPDSVVTITPAAGPTAIITIKNNKGQTKTITINGVGLVDID